MNSLRMASLSCLAFLAVLARDIFDGVTGPTYLLHQLTTARATDAEYRLSGGPVPVQRFPSC